MFPVSLSFDARSSTEQQHKNKGSFQSLLNAEQGQDESIQSYNDKEIEEKLLTLRIKLAELKAQREKSATDIIALSPARVVYNYNETENAAYIQAYGLKTYQDNDARDHALGFYIDKSSKVKVLI